MTANVAPLSGDKTDILLGDAEVASKIAISMVIPAYNASAELLECLRSLEAGTIRPFECIVVDDGSSDDTTGVAARFKAKVLSTGGRRGPAYARNLGAQQATGNVLFFIDADVCVHEDTLEKIRGAFARDPQIDAVIGSYDDSPARLDVLSQYRNLMHCYTHQNGAKRASTFWSGCGAIKRDVFLAAGGFDATYRKPAIEDIELGYRLTAAGKVIQLESDIQVKHLKRWTFTNIVRTDVFQRGIPWTLLILRAGRMPNDLNLKWTQRLSVALVGLLAALVAVAVAMQGGNFLTPLLGLTLLVLGSFWVAEALEPEGRLVRIALAVFLATFTGLAYERDLIPIIPVVFAAYLLLFLREKLTLRRPRARRVSGLLYGVYLVASLLFVISYMPQKPLLFIFLFLLGMVFLLNYRFYLFLFNRTGKLRGLAAIPFHLLFHIYSGLSFAAGAMQHHYARLRRNGT